MPSVEPSGATRDITIRNINGRTVLSLQTSLTHKNCDQLETLFNGLLKREVKEMVLDFTKVTFLDSKALEQMADMQTRLQAVGGHLTLSNLNEVCRDILICVRLMNQFNMITKAYGNS